jgi:hypothetical protein
VLFSIPKPFESNSSRAAVTGFLLGAALVGIPCTAQAVVIPAYTTTDSTLGSYEEGPASFGFWFDTTRDVKVDALGFASQETWNTGSTSYNVGLWSYINGGTVPGDFTPIASRTFTPTGTLPSYYFQDGYFWQNIDVVTLPDSTKGDPTGESGYVVGVSGDFTQADGHVKFEAGTAAFLPGFSNNLAVFGTLADGFWPIPTFIADPDLGANAYFNGNFSLAPVPSPLPLLGAAAAFSWSNRLRKRIRRASL